MNVPNQNLTEFDNVRISVVLSCSLYNHLQVTGLLLGCSNLRPPCGWCQIMLVESWFQCVRHCEQLWAEAAAHHLSCELQQPTLH